MWTLFSANTWSVVMTGLIVVFVALIGLVVFLWLSGNIFSSIEKKKNKKNNQSNNNTKENTVVSEVKSTPVQDTLIPQEDENLIAVLTAAISASFAASGNNNGFVIKSIRRKKDTKNAWNSAGILDNTRPF